MPQNRYSEINEISAFGFLINAQDRNKGADGDVGAMFPRSDAEDMSKGARFIPGEVTVARRRGEQVEFVTDCGRNCWYWKMPDDSRIYHWDPFTYEQIGIANNRPKIQGKFEMVFENGCGPCPNCGNPNTSGGTIKPDPN